MTTYNYFYDAIAILWGSIGLLSFAFCYLLTPAAWISDASDQKRVRAAQHRLWSLSSSPEGLKHNFLEASAGCQLHYLTNSDEGLDNGQPRTLIVFLHGFPDSAHIFARYLSSAALKTTNASLVTLDLPGYGGSDSLKHYGATEVLNTVAAALLELAHKYHADGSDGKLILVGHDWGGIIASRIATETNVVDRLVLVNTTHWPHVKANAADRVRQAKEQMRAGHLGAAWRVISPLLGQLVRSIYIFVFNLPIVILAVSPSGTMLYLLDMCHQNGHHRGRTAATEQLAISRAIANGPSIEDCANYNANGKTYGPSVLARAQIRPSGDWLQRIRLYRDGLAAGEWKVNDLVKARAGDRLEQDEGRFSCSVTVIYGLQDLALDPRIMLDGIERFFLGPPPLSHIKSEAQNGSSTVGDQASHIIRLENCGHWSLLEEPLGTVTLETVLWWLVSGSGQAKSEAGRVGSLEQTLRVALVKDGDSGDQVSIATFAG